jgi:hypothetical protein
MNTNVLENNVRKSIQELKGPGYSETFNHDGHCRQLMTMKLTNGNGKGSKKLEKASQEV